MATNGQSARAGRSAFRTLWETLPGRAVAAAVLVNGEMWLIMDPAKVGKASNLVTCVTDILMGGGAS